MPIYEYGCQSCGQRQEVMHGVNDPGPTRCTACGGPMRKLLSPPAIVFKGSGWAKKDARDSRAAPSKPAAADKDGGGEGNSEPAAPQAATGASEGTKGDASSKGSAGTADATSG